MNSTQKKILVGIAAWLVVIWAVTSFTSWMDWHLFERPITMDRDLAWKSWRGVIILDAKAGIDREYQLQEDPIESDQALMIALRKNDLVLVNWDKKALQAVEKNGRVSRIELKDTVPSDYLVSDIQATRSGALINFYRWVCEPGNKEYLGQGVLVVDLPSGKKHMMLNALAARSIPSSDDVAALTTKYEVEGRSGTTVVAKVKVEKEMDEWYYDFDNNIAVLQYGHTFVLKGPDIDKAWTLKTFWEVELRGCNGRNHQIWICFGGGDFTNWSLEAYDYNGRRIGYVSGLPMGLFDPVQEVEGDPRPFIEAAKNVKWP